MLSIAPEASETVLILFSLFCSASIISVILSSRSLIHSFVSDSLLLVPFSVFVISVIVLFIAAAAKSRQACPTL